MSFISHAQNYEDIILHRALKHLEKGIYIDVGANDPEIDSVTKAFYDAGWRGINIEPVTEWYDRLCEERPDDINLQVAVGDQDGEVDFYELVGTGLSTMDKPIAERIVQERGYAMESYKVPVTTLAAICEKHPFPDIHFLKVDVEGAEKSVLLGMDFDRFRPWICLVESTLPNMQEESHEEWESILLSAGYQFVYFDGLNRFYVAEEHIELEQKLAIPPNVFDDFLFSGRSHSGPHYQISEIRSSLENAHEKETRLEAQIEKALVEAASLEKLLSEMREETEKQKICIQRLENEQEKITEQVGQLHSANLQLQLEVENSNAELLAVYQSKSWRITLPLRVLWKPFDRERQKGKPVQSEYPSAPQQHSPADRLTDRSVNSTGFRVLVEMIRWPISKAMQFVLYRPRLASGLVKILSRVPYVHGKLVAYATHEGLITHSHAPVPKQPKINVTDHALTGSQGSQSTGENLIDEPVFKQPLDQSKKSKGKYHEQKSPLEQWFS